MKTSTKIISLLLATIALAGIGYGITSFKKETTEQIQKTKIREVVVEKISDLDKKTDPLPLIGK